MTNPNTTEAWLVKILNRYIGHPGNNYTYEDRKREISELKTEILTHIAEVLEDESHDDYCTEILRRWDPCVCGTDNRNQLRAELRQKLGITENGEK